MSPLARGCDDVAGVAQHDDFPAEMQALSSRHDRKGDRARSHNFEDEVAPSTTYSRRNRRKRTHLKEKVRSSQDHHTPMLGVGFVFA